MKVIFVVIFLVLCFSCMKKSATENKEEVKITQEILEPEFQSIIDQKRSNIEGFPTNGIYRVKVELLSFSEIEFNQ